MTPTPQSLGIQECVLRLTIATLIGAAVGLNRELRHKPAGLRTHALVSLGAALVTTTMFKIAADAGIVNLDGVSRVIQGIVAGVGFIGGGVILHRDDSKGVHGLTTAASIWVVAALGIAAGAGEWEIAVAALGLSLLMLSLGGAFERYLKRHHINTTDPDHKSAAHDSGPEQDH